MEVSLALLADAANATESKKLNVLGIFGNINPPVLPYRHPSMTLVLKFEVDPLEANTDKTIRIVCVDPDGAEITSLEVQAHIPENSNPGQVMELVMNLGFNGLKFDRPGPHAFAVLVNGETKKRVPLIVTEPRVQPMEGQSDDRDS